MGLQIGPALRRTEQLDRALEGGAGAGLQEDLLLCQQLPQEGVKRPVLNGHLAGKQRLHHPTHKAGGPAHRQPVGLGQAGKPQILNRDGIVQAGGHADEHTGGLNRLCKKAVDAVAEDLLQPEGHAAGSAAHAAGNGHQ